VSTLEREHAGEALGSFFVEIAIYTSSCVIAAAAAVEALINAPGGASGRAKRAAGLEAKPALEKYRRALILQAVRHRSAPQRPIWIHCFTFMPTVPILSHLPGARQNVEFLGKRTLRPLPWH
jgi:hypothetical protein